MSSAEGSSSSRAALAAAVMLLAALFAVAMLSEWWPIAVTRSAARIASYHFGSPSMVAHGGWRYANPSVYAWTAFAEAMAALATLPAVWMTIVRRSRKAAYALLFICAVYVACAAVLGRIDWPRAARDYGSTHRESWRSNSAISLSACPSRAVSSGFASASTICLASCKVSSSSKVRRMSSSRARAACRLHDG